MGVGLRRVGFSVGGLGFGVRGFGFAFAKFKTFESITANVRISMNRIQTDLTNNCLSQNGLHRDCKMLTKSIKTLSHSNKRFYIHVGCCKTSSAYLQPKTFKQHSKKCANFDESDWNLLRYSLLSSPLSSAPSCAALPFLTLLAPSPDRNSVDTGNPNVSTRSWHARLCSASLQCCWKLKALSRTTAGKTYKLLALSGFSPGAWCACHNANNVLLIMSTR